MESKNEKYKCEHVISDEAFDHIKSELLKGNQWIAYNTVSYFLDKNEVCFFNKKDEANEFAENNISEYEDYRVIKAISVDDVFKQIPYWEEGLSNQINLNTQKTNFMNQKNLDYLNDQVKFTGFGEELANELKEKIEKQTPEFQIAHKTKFGNDDVSSVLHFKKSDQTDMYFFNRYEVSLKPQQSTNEAVQTFYINKGNNITLKEAFNLMNGRAVNKDLTNKENEVYNAWVQLDFKQTDAHGNNKMKQYHENYGYDLNAALAKHPIKELGNEQDKTRLEQSLQKGNVQSVSFVQNGNEQKHFIEANPQFKTINVYDSSMHRLSNKQALDEKQEQGERQSSKKNAKNESQNQSDVGDSDAMPKAANKRRKKQTNSVH